MNRPCPLRRVRPVQPEADEEALAAPEDRLRAISAWSLVVLATIATGAVLHLTREFLLPIVTAFVVGVMLAPIARRLEARKVPRVASAALIVVCTALLIAASLALIASPVEELVGKLPALGNYGPVPRRVDMAHYRVERAPDLMVSLDKPLFLE